MDRLLLLGGMFISAVAIVGIALQIRTRPADDAERRRKLAVFHPDVQVPENIKVESLYFTTSEQILLHYVLYTPKDQPCKAVICLCHGYANSATYTFHMHAVRLAKEGYVVVNLDLEGHGRSEGLHVYVESFKRMANGAHEVFQYVKETKFPNEKFFLFGESMGGAVVCRIVIDFNPKDWNGVVLLAPMVKIARKMMAPAPIVTLLKFLAKIVPTWPIVPSPDLIDKAHRREEGRILIRNGPLYYRAAVPRVQTALELLNSTTYLEQRMEHVSCPLLICHGSADLVTDPNISIELYERSNSKDKTLKIYDDMWHSLIVGELLENREKVWTDILSWLNERSR